jgi:hypothetical protein
MHGTVRKVILIVCILITAEVYIILVGIGLVRGGMVFLPVREILPRGLDVNSVDTELRGIGTSLGLRAESSAQIRWMSLLASIGDGVRDDLVDL